MNMQAHHFGSGTFTTELWIASRRVFPGLTGVDVEFVNGGAWTWLIADASGGLVKMVDHSNSNGGWTSIDLASLGLRGSYRVGFRNASPGPKQIKQGVVRFT